MPNPKDFRVQVGQKKPIDVKVTRTPNAKASASAPKKPGPTAKGPGKPRAKKASKTVPPSTGLPPNNTESLQTDAKNTVIQTTPVVEAAHAVDAVPISIVLNYNGLVGIAYAWIEHAIAHGWNEGVVYDAVYALCNEFVNAMADKECSSKRAPRLFWELCDGLAPASCGALAYSWSVSELLDGSISFGGLPSVASAGQTTSGDTTADSSGLAPFYASDSAVNAPYYSDPLVDTGILALQSLWSFYESMGYEVVPYAVNKKYRNSVSAYAYNVVPGTAVPFPGVFENSSCPVFGLEGRKSNTIPWLSQLNLAATATDVWGNPRVGGQFWMRSVPGKAVMGHRIVNKLSGMNKINSNIKFKCISLEWFVQAAYTIYTQVVTKSGGGSGTQPHDDWAAFPANQFALVVWFYVRSYFSKWASVIGGTEHGSAGLCGCWTEWNWAPNNYTATPLPAVLVEGLRSYVPVYYTETDTWVYPVLCIPNGYLAAFDATNTAAPDKLLATSTACGSTLLEPNTGRITSAPSVLPYNLTNAGILGAIQIFATAASFSNDYVAQYAGNPAHHQVELTLMHYVDILTFGLDLMTIASKSDPKRFNRLRRPSLFQRGVLDVYKEVPLGRKIALRMSDYKRGVVIPAMAEFDKLNVKLLRPLMEKWDIEHTRGLTFVSLMTVTRVAFTSQIAINDANLKSDTMFHLPFFLTEDPMGVDAMGYYNTVATELSPEATQALPFLALLGRNVAMVHAAAAEDNTEDGLVMAQRAKYGCGGATSSSSVGNLFGGLAKSGIDLLTHLIF